MQQNCFVAFPDLCLDTILSLSSAFLSYGLVFALICIVRCETLYRQVSTFPNHVQSIELPQVDSNQGVETFQR